MTDHLLAAHGLHSIRGGRSVLADVDLEIARGDSVAVTGPSGSGKSTLLALLAGLERPHRGSVERRVADAEVGLVLQGYGLVSLLTAEENVALPLQAPGRPRLPRSEVRDRARAALAEVGLDPVADHLVEALSGGQQQRVAVARALITAPALVLADEPTAALDAENRERIAALLFALPARGATLVIATHDPVMVAKARRTVAVVDGRISRS